MACSLSPGAQDFECRVPHADLGPACRTKTEFQLPYRSGMSRQGAPVRRGKIQRMPLTIRRLSEIGGPRSPEQARDRCAQRKASRPDEQKGAPEIAKVPEASGGSKFL